MLAGGDFVVGVFHFDAHRLQGEDCVSPQVARHVQGGEVEIAALIQNFRLAL